MSNELLKRLIELVLENDAAKMVVDIAGLPTDKIDFSGSAKIMWYNVLKEAKKHNNGVLKIIDSVLLEYPEDKILLEEKSKLLPNLSAEDQPATNIPQANTPIDKAALKSLIGNNKIKEVIELLYNSSKLDSENQNQLLSFKRQHKGLEKEKRLGIIAGADYNLGINKITAYLLDFIDSVDM